jgi:ABC-type nickel/cobalt efflux system permease component RcnA
MVISLTSIKQINTTMKKQVIRLIALLIFASVAMSSCSVEYRERHRHHYDDRDHDNHDHDRDHNDNH